MNDKFKTPMCPMCGQKMKRTITRTKSQKTFYTVAIWCPNETKSALCHVVHSVTRSHSKERAKAQATHFVSWLYNKYYGRTLFAE